MLSVPSVWRLETLREDGDFVLYRGWKNTDPSPVLVVAPASEYPAPGSLERLDHEHSLKDILDTEGVARPLALVFHEGRRMLVREDPGGEPLDRLLGRPLDMTAFLRLATGLSCALGKLHQRGLIHKDIRPANILVDAATGNVWLTGFGIASRIPRERQAPEPPETLGGTLAYMAPEQTGRMNRSIDSRSDLYSLGVTLYEMLTGGLPFTASDPMEWIHCHIARSPTPPDERAKGIPKPVSAIIMKLLAKDPEDRYQTAAGVEADLKRCLAEWQAAGRIGFFALGAHDIWDRLLIPEKLYGREEEVAALFYAFERVVASGTQELVLVSGYSGVGKSSVVNELHKAIVLPRGIFLAGKFDQHRRNVPYATIAQAFRTFIRQLLGLSEAEIGRWREAIREAVGSNGRLVIDLVSELDLIIGAQPPVPELAPREAEYRFHTVFRQFLGVFARKEHPLVLFLDDVQWLDAASLALLEYLVTHPDVRHLLLIGAYRDNEVGPAHPLMLVLDAVRKAGATVHEIQVPPLSRNDLDRLVADALHGTPARVEPLAWLVHEKTAGNPFFAVQFLTALTEEHLLVYDARQADWQWDLERIRAKGFTDNVADLMIGKLKRFPAATQMLLQHLACLGGGVDTAILAMAQGASEEAVHVTLWEALRAGLVQRRQGAYAFAHDRIREAAYALVPEDERAGWHLRLGRLLASRLPAEAVATRLFDAVNQFNQGAALIEEPEERVQVAGLNLRAARQAKTAAAFRVAAGHLAAAMAMLSDAAWERQYALMFALWLERAECAYLSGDFDEVERLFPVLLQRARTGVDRAAAYRVVIDTRVTRGEDGKAIASALDGLRMFGINLSAHPSADEVREAYQAIGENLGARAIEDLVDQPLMTDPEMQAAMEILARLYAPAYHCDNNLFYLHVFHGVNISLRHGNAPASTHAYGWFGVILSCVFHRPQDGNRFAELAYDLMERHRFLAYKAKAIFVLRIIALWTQPLDRMLDYSRAAFDAAVETGDVPLACFSRNHTAMGLVMRGDRLSDIHRETEQGIDFVRRAGFRDVQDMIVGIERFVQAMRGRTRHLSTYDDERFSEADFESGLTQDRMPTLLFYYHAVKLMARFLSGDYEAALAAGETCKALSWAGLFSAQGLYFHFYHALTLAAVFDTLSPDQRKEALDAAAAHQELLRQSAETYSPTFHTMHALVSAEIARLRDSGEEAMRLYEEAIRSARDHGFVQNEALANELAARFHRARGFETIANAYLRRARAGYARWGADGKVRQLDRAFPHLREEAPPVSAAAIGAPVEHLDLMTVVKASQAVSGEIVLDKLIERLMVITVEHAGADRGLLILPQNDAAGAAPWIEAEARSGHDRVDVVRRQAPLTPAVIPETVLRYVLRTQKSVLLDDASTPNLFSADPYLCRNRARSVLCLPLVKQARLVGVLYLENSLAPHAFTPDRIAILELLAAQAAISLENARLYADLQQENSERRRAEAALREREARIRRLVDSNIIGVLFWDFDGNVTEANDAFLDMVGYTRQELRSGKIQWTAMTPPEYRAVDARGAEELRSTGTVRPFEKEYVRKDGRRVPVLLGGALFEGSQNEGVAFVLDLTERRQAEERQKRLLNELNHRVKNTLATVRAIAGQTLRTAESPRSFVDAFDARLLALSQAHNLLTEGQWQGASLRSVLRLELAPYAGSEADRFVLAGGAVHLSPKATVTLAMAFHELATNAAKYGALSVPAGQVRIAWTADERRLRLEWRETGGPSVQAPRRKGFGRRLLEQGVGNELAGRVHLDFGPDGMRCTMDLPLNQIATP